MGNFNTDFYTKVSSGLYTSFVIKSTISIYQPLYNPYAIRVLHKIKLNKTSTVKTLGIFQPSLSNLSKRNKYDLFMCTHSVIRY